MPRENGDAGRRPPNLNENARLQLYAAGKMQKVTPGAAVAASNKPGAWYLVVQGRLRLEGSTGATGGLSRETFDEGAWFGAESVRLVAAEPSSVMEFTPAAFRQLPAEIQLQAHASLAGKLGQINRDLESASIGLVRARELSRGLIDRMYAGVRALLAAPPVDAFLNTLPALPPSLSLILHSNSEEVMEQILTEAKRDPGLAALVLKTANSAALRRGAEIADLHRACLHVGYVKVCQLALEYAVGQIMDTGEDQKALQDHTTLIAAASSEIALLAFKKDSQVATTIGLLHHVGSAGLRVFRRKDPQHGWLADSIDAAGFGARLLEVWKLPVRVTRAVALQDIPDMLPPTYVAPEQQADLATLHTAHACERYLMKGEQAGGPFEQEYFSLLKLPYRDTADFCEQWLRQRLVQRLPHLRSRLTESQDTEAQPESPEKETPGT